MCRFVLFSVITLFSVAMSIALEASAADKNNLTDMRKIIKILEETRSEPVVLKGKDKKAMVVVAPKLVGRVLCTSFDGEDGQTSGFVNEKQLRKGCSTSGFAARSGPEDGWNNFGGAERILFAPEGGRYGLFFDPGVEQNLHNYRMSYPLHEVPYKVVDQPSDEKSVTFSAPIHLVNYCGSKINLEVTRKITVLDRPVQKECDAKRSIIEA